MTNWKDVIENNYWQLVDAIMDLEMSDPKVSTDLYLCPDGTTYRYENPSGIDWNPGNVCKIWTCDHSDLDADWYDEDGEILIDPWEVRDYASQALDDIMWQLDRENSPSEIVNHALYCEIQDTDIIPYKYNVQIYSNGCYCGNGRYCNTLDEIEAFCKSYNCLTVEKRNTL